MRGMVQLCGFDGCFLFRRGSRGVTGDEESEILGRGMRGPIQGRA